MTIDKNIDIDDKKAKVKFRNFNWEKARTFYIVAKKGTISGAANFFHISQSAVSRQIIDLERALGMMLFVREPRGVRLTRKGEELYNIVETTFSNLTGFTRNTHAELHKSKKRKISIATTQPVASYIINDLLLDYSEIDQEVIFEVITDDHLIDLTLNDVDIAIRPIDLGARGVCQKHILTLEKRLYASQSYIDKYGEPQSIEDLRYHLVLAGAHTDDYPYSDLEWILRLGMPEGELHEPSYTSTSTECLFNVAQRGKGIIGSYEQMKILKKSNLKNILPNVKDKKNKFYFVYPEYLENDLKIQQLKTFLYERLNQ